METVLPGGRAMRSVKTRSGLANERRQFPRTDISEYLHHTMTFFGVPGATVTVVANGAVEAYCHGVRKLGASAQVDLHTTFPIGSNTKAFTAAAIAILVDRGELNWDDCVVDHLPEFRMHDDYASRHMSIKDLFTHRSGLGLGQGDLLFVPSTNRTRAELVYAIRHLKPAFSFRSRYAYVNVLYAVAGQLIEAVTGLTWETFIRRNIFRPLGMTDAAVDFWAQGSNRATTHVDVGGPNDVARALTPLKSDGITRPISPAGGICASAADMGRWLSTQLTGGKTRSGRQLFSATQSKVLWDPVTVVPIEPLPAVIAAATPISKAYALGFLVVDYRGCKLITHEGGVLGGFSEVILIPDRNIAFSVMINSDNECAMMALVYHLLDHFLDLPPTNWTRRFQKVAVEHQRGEASEGKAHLVRERLVRRSPLPLEVYAGVYRDAWYGTISIRCSSDRLRIRFDRSPGMRGRLHHVRNDTFRAVWSDRTIPEAFITFSLDADGHVIQARMRAVSPTVDFSWDYHDLELFPLGRRETAVEASTPPQRRGL